MPDRDTGRVNVASPEHLVASKLAARRPKDLRAKAALDRLIAARARKPGPVLAVLRAAGAACG